MLRKVLDVVGLLLALAMLGTVGLHMIEGARWIDCFYMAVITLTTVGYGEVVPLSDTGRIFIVCYLVMGLGTFSYSAFSLGQLIVSKEFQKLWERRRMTRDISHLHGHYIVCGIGRMGNTICQFLSSHRKQFVVIDSNEELLESQCRAHNWMYILGDATDDAVLLKAGIERASSLSTVLTTDADNVYVVLSARLLNGKIPIIARASDEKAIEKLTRAGATRVISPFSSGAVKMARLMIHPSVEDLLEIADGDGGELELADVTVNAGSSLIGKKLMETKLREKGVMIIGIRRANGERLIPPPGSAVIEAGDSLFAFGGTDAVNEVINASD